MNLIALSFINKNKGEICIFNNQILEFDGVDFTDKSSPKYKFKDGNVYFNIEAKDDVNILFLNKHPDEITYQQIKKQYKDESQT